MSFAYYTSKEKANVLFSRGAAFMNKLTKVLLTVSLLASASAHAGLISVIGPNSNLGTLPSIIGAPAHVLDDIVTNTGMQGFDEAQNVTTSIAYTTDSGVIAAGTTVDSHMIFLNTQGPNLGVHAGAVWTFSGNILGIMSDRGGFLEAASSAELGAPGTNYTVGAGAPPFPARGLESNNGTGLGANDGYQMVAPNVLRVSMRVTEPGDWIRVVTASTVPEPATLGILGLGLTVLGFARRRRVAA